MHLPYEVHLTSVHLYEVTQTDFTKSGLKLLINRGPYIFAHYSLLFSGLLFRIIFFYSEHAHSKRTKQTVCCNIFELAEIKL